MAHAFAPASIQPSTFGPLAGLVASLQARRMIQQITTAQIGEPTPRVAATRMTSTAQTLHRRAAVRSTGGGR